MMRRPLLIGTMSLLLLGATFAEETDLFRPLAVAAQAGFLPQGFNDIINQLANADYQRLAAPGVREYPDIEQLKLHLQYVWERKYGQPLDMNDSQVFTAYPGLKVTQSQQTATVLLPAQGPLPAVKVSLIYEQARWRINIPKKLTREQLHQNLLRQLQDLSNHTGDWPKEEIQAKRLLAHRVMLALNSEP
jgi:hypothetical protein